jgi:hypothetical protein
VWLAAGSGWRRGWRHGSYQTFGEVLSNDVW